VARGGHIRVGLEDAPLGTLASNLTLAEEAMQIVSDLGAEPASVADLRLALAAEQHRAGCDSGRVMLGGCAADPG
jgi:3-keto-5-aminohexanoate cleavage enzyme